MKTVKIPARLRRIMGLAPVLEFELSSVRPVVVAIVLYVLNIMYVIIIAVFCQVTSSYRRQQVA